MISEKIYFELLYGWMALAVIDQLLSFEIVQ